jgi:hypothetical protein
VTIRRAALRERITLFNRVPSAAKSRYGDPIDAELPGVEVKAAIQPVGGSGGVGATIELEQSRDTRISRYVCTVAPIEPVDALARVEWLGRSFEVVGEPRLFMARGLPHHYEFTIEEVLG